MVIQTRTPSYGTDALHIPRTPLNSHSFHLTHALSHTLHGVKNVLLLILSVVFVPRDAKATYNGKIYVNKLRVTDVVWNCLALGSRSKQLFSPCSPLFPGEATQSCSENTYCRSSSTLSSCCGVRSTFFTVNTRRGKDSSVRSLARRR